MKPEDFPYRIPTRAEYSPTKTLTVNVTEQDILFGERDNCLECPVARALNRHGVDDIEVFIDYVVFFDSDKNRVRIPLPTHVTGAIRRFDDGGTVAPFSFRIEVPELF